MASLFDKDWVGPVRLLDAGAGVGSLTAAFVEEFCRSKSVVPSIDATAYELDPIMAEFLQTTLFDCERVCDTAGIRFSSEFLQMDFIETCTNQLLSIPGPLFADSVPGLSFTHVIMNPPYKKIHSASVHRRQLQSVGIETSNLYTAFLSLAIKLLAKEGELVAITPRSFCNGPYFKPFRELLLGEMNLRRIHVFESRTDAFSDDEVLQESVIFHAVKNQSQSTCRMSQYRKTRGFSKLRSRSVDFARIVPQSPGMFSFILSRMRKTSTSPIECTPCPIHLQDLGINASTGPVVDFQAEKVSVQES